jgi:hypothetical protein
LTAQNIFEKNDKANLLDWDIAAVRCNDDNDEDWFVMKLCHKTRKITIRKTKVSGGYLGEMPGLKQLGDGVKSVKQSITGEWTYEDKNGKSLSFVNGLSGNDFDSILDRKRVNDYLAERESKIIQKYSFQGSPDLSIIYWLHKESVNWESVYFFDMLKWLKKEKEESALKAK